MAASGSAAAAAQSAEAAAESARTLTIDTTLTQAGQAADAKKVGDSVTDLKSALLADETRGKTKKTVTGTTIKLFEKDISNVAFQTNNEVKILGLNRFDIDSAVIQHDGYGSTVITKTDTGISVYYPGGGTSKSAFTNYTAELSGDLWISCKAHTDGNVKDLRMNVFLNGTLCASCYGPGLLKEKITVTDNDTIQIKFLIRNQDNITNTVYYEDIMISYTDSDFVPFNDYTNKNIDVVIRALSGSSDDWSTSTAAPGVTGKNLKYNTIFDDMPVPSAGSVVPSGVTVSGDLDLIPYNSVYNGTEGMGISATGSIMIYVSGCATKDAYITWLSSHPLTISYNGSQYIITPFDASMYNFETGEIVVFNTATEIEYYYRRTEEASKYKMVCFGDSITGMFGFDTDYPAMISDSSRIEAINCGFSGSTWTDYGTGNLMPFSINRLADSIVAEDFTLQDDVIGSITTAWYAEHLTALKAISWDEITFVTFLAGVNDWYYAQHPLYSADDESETNKQRTNVQDAVRYCIAQMLTKYPHLKIIVLTPYHAYMHNLDSDTTDGTHPNTLDKYAEVMKECAEEKRIPHIEQYTNSGINQLTMYYYTSDGTHPNEAMKHMIAKRIIKTAETITENSLT